MSQSTGVIVSIAILAHDLLRMASIPSGCAACRTGAVVRAAVAPLDAVAPVLGAASTFAFHPAAAQLGLALAVFCGLFLYIGASDLLPESYHAHPTRLATIATLAGAALLYLAVRLGRG